VAAIIVNYNMPERAEALARYIWDRVKWPCDIFLVDNGSDLCAPAPSTTLRLERNVQTTGGWLAGLSQAREAGEYLGYWFLITSAEFPTETQDFAIETQDFASVPRLLVEDENAVGVSPALTVDSTTAWKHLIARNNVDPGQDQPGCARRTWMIDNIASLWRADWFDEQGGFDAALVYAWGIDLELCYKARQQGRSLWVHEGCRVKKVTDIGYAMGRMNMTSDERRSLAGANMDEVLRRKYGENWNWKMREEYVEDGWR
jgi:hypothetical protein